MTREEVSVFFPYGNNVKEEREEILERLKNGWKVALVYGGERPTVILSRLKKSKKK